MNKEQSDIAMNHLWVEVPKLTKPLFKKLDLSIMKKGKPFNYKHQYQALNCHIVVTIMKFLAERI